MAEGKVFWEKVRVIETRAIALNIPRLIVGCCGFIVAMMVLAGWVCRKMTDSVSCKYRVFRVLSFAEMQIFGHAKLTIVDRGIFDWTGSEPMTECEEEIACIQCKRVSPAFSVQRSVKYNTIRTV